MKKIVLALAVLFLATPAAMAKDMQSCHGMTKGHASVKTTAKTSKTVSSKDYMDASAEQTFQLSDGRRIVTKGRAIYLVDQDGSRYFAPNAQYRTVDGKIFSAENGLVLRVRNPDGNYSYVSKP